MSASLYFYDRPGSKARAQRHGVQGQIEFGATRTTSPTWPGLHFRVFAKQERVFARQEPHLPRAAQHAGALGGAVAGAAAGGPLLVNAVARDPGGQIWDAACHHPQNLVVPQPAESVWPSSHPSGTPQRLQHI
jgi:hypothetical protein